MRQVGITSQHKPTSLCKCFSTEVKKPLFSCLPSLLQHVIPTPCPTSARVVWVRLPQQQHTLGYTPCNYMIVSQFKSFTRFLLVCDALPSHLQLLAWPLLTNLLATLNVITLSVLLLSFGMKSLQVCPMQSPVQKAVQKLVGSSAVP